MHYTKKWWTSNTNKEIKMTEEIKDVNAKIDAADAAVKKYASKDTVISIGGYEFTPAKLMVAFTLASSLLGGLYGCFQVYQDYMNMKNKIANYTAPDLSDYDKRIAILEKNSQQTEDYTRDIKNDLKGDIRRNETVTEQVERAVKQSQRETDADLRQSRKDLRDDLDKARADVTAVRQEMSQARKEIDQEVKMLQKEVDSKIQKAIDNPLANK
jgi:predicted  nucleic acid-binding Zn-ribbon protein